MRSVTGTRTVPCSPEAAFAALADFSRCQEWDPGVAHAERLDNGPIAVGSRFMVHARFLGQTISMQYQVLVHEAPARLVLVGRADRSTATDRLTFRAVPEGTEITWRLELQMHGISKLSEPLLGPALNHLATSAMDGLASWSELHQ